MYCRLIVMACKGLDETDARPSVGPDVRCKTLLNIVSDKFRKLFGMQEWPDVARSTVDLQISAMPCLGKANKAEVCKKFCYFLLLAVNRVDFKCF